jgi:hypothetical protein
MQAWVAEGHFFFFFVGETFSAKRDELSRIKTPARPVSHGYGSNESILELSFEIGCLFFPERVDRDDRLPRHGLVIS